MTSAEVEIIATRVGILAESVATEVLKVPSLSHAQVAAVVRARVEESVRANLTKQGALI